MSKRYGTVVIDERAEPGTATVRVSLEDARIADASSVRLAETVLRGVEVVPGARIPFVIEADDVPAGITVRVHVDYSGDRELAVGDQFSTISIPADVLGATADAAGEVPVARI